jgi:hypothetical protein
MLLSRLQYFFQNTARFCLAIFQCSAIVRGTGLEDRGTGYRNWIFDPVPDDVRTIEELAFFTVEDGEGMIPSL